MEDADRLSEKASRELHQPDYEGISWTYEVERMVCRILHDGQALTNVALDDQMHQDYEYKSRNQVHKLVWHHNDFIRTQYHEEDEED